MARPVNEFGVNYLECYGDPLRGIYESIGFKLESSAPFDPAQAKPNWNYAKYNNPNYYTLRLPK